MKISKELREKIANSGAPEALRAPDDSRLGELPVSGEIRRLYPPEGPLGYTPPVMVVEAHDDPASALVALVSDDWDIAEEGDLLLPPESTIFSMPLVVHMRLLGYVWQGQLSRQLIGTVQETGSPTSEIRTREDMRFVRQEEMREEMKPLLADSKEIARALPPICIET